MSSGPIFDGGFKLKQASLAALFIIVFFCSPFLILFFKVPEMGGVAWAELFWALKNTFLQAFGSAVLSLLFGSLGIGLIFWTQLRLGSKLRLFAEVFLLLPSLLPPLFVLLNLLKLIAPFPYGVAGIILVHSVMNAGLCSVALARVLESTQPKLMDLCLIEGCGALRFLRMSLLGYLKKAVFSLGLFVFSLSFTSFAVPLIVAGDQGTTLEVLIFEKIRIEADLAGAISLALLQSLFIFVLSVFLWRQRPQRGAIPQAHALLARPWTSLPLVAISAALILSQGYGVFRGLSSLLDLPLLSGVLFKALAGSFFVGMSVGLVCFFLLQLNLYLILNRSLPRFFLGYLAPSAVLTAFAFLLVTPDEPPFSYLRLIFALSLLFFPAIYRLGWYQLLENLRGQVIVARSLGASSWESFKTVSYPQALPRAAALSAIVGFWATGDFAISRILLGGDRTLGLLVDSLMGFYRLDEALALSGLLLVLGFLVAAALGALAYVGRRKSYL